MEQFYLGLLGDHVRSRRSGFVNFDLDGARLTITVHDAVHGPAADPARIMVNLSVEDARLWFHRAVELSAPIVRHPEQESWGGVVCTFADPDGNYLQFMQLP